MVDASSRMRAVRRRDTTAERELQVALSRLRLRFQTHTQILGCRPDIVLRTSRLAMFVDGDFWHGRLLLERGRRALNQSFRTRTRVFWVAKIERNVARDFRQTRILRRHGWAVVRLWEKDVLKNPNAAAALVSRRVRERRQKLRKQRRDVA